MHNIKSRVMAVVAILAAVIGFNVVSAPASHAGNFNDVTHAANDSGYSAPIKIECSDGRIRWLYKGESSPSKCGFHVARIIPGADQAVRCQNIIPPYQWLYYLQPGGVDSFVSLKCWMQRPI